MMFDLHMHVWESLDQLGPAAAENLRSRGLVPWERPDASLEALADAIGPIDGGAVLGFESGMLGASVPASLVARAVAANPQKLVGFAGIDPMLPGFLHKLDQAVSLGMVGVVISPAAGGYHPCHTRALRLFEECQSRSLPVIVHGATHTAPQAMLEYAQPHLLDEVIRNFPRLKMLLTQVAHPYTDVGLSLLVKHPALLADISDLVLRPMQLYQVLLSAHQQGVLRQLVLGSDFPFCTPEQAIATVYSVNTMLQGTHLPTIPRDQLRAMLEKNSLALLGVKHSLAPEKASKAALTGDRPVVDMEVVVPSPVKAPPAFGSRP